MSEAMFAPLAREFVRRTARATVSQLSPASRTLAQHLLGRLERDAGSPGSFVAEPVFEPLFEWEKCGRRLDDVEFLHPKLIDAMDASAGDYRFPRERQPYPEAFSCGIGLMLLHLDEHIENSRKMFRWNAIACITYLQHCCAIFGIRLHAHLAPGRRELGSVGQQVYCNLGQPVKIAKH